MKSHSVFRILTISLKNIKLFGSCNSGTPKKHEKLNFHLNCTVDLEESYIS